MVRVYSLNKNTKALHRSPFVFSPEYGEQLVKHLRGFVKHTLFYMRPAPPNSYTKYEVLKSWANPTANEVKEQLEYLERRNEYARHNKLR